MGEAGICVQLLFNLLKNETFSSATVFLIASILSFNLLFYIPACRLKQYFLKHK